MKIIFLILSCVAFSYGASVDCTQIFESRKSELVQYIEKIDDARQSFMALKAATNSMFDKQKARVDMDRKALNQKKEALNQKQKNIEDLIAKNQKLLESIKGAKNNKITETYMKMKDSAAAGIFEELSTDEASAIIFFLPAKKISQILAKMDPIKASKITERLKQGPPFKTKKKNK